MYQEMHNTLLKDLGITQEPLPRGHWIPLREIYQIRGDQGNLCAELSFP